MSVNSVEGIIINSPRNKIVNLYFKNQFKKMSHCLYEMSLTPANVNSYVSVFEVAKYKVISDTAVDSEYKL